MTTTDSSILQEFSMCSTDDIETTNEVEMYRHVEPIEAPLNGLEDFINWDTLEQGLANGDYACKQDFRAEITAQFELAGVPFTHHFYRQAVKGLFPEFHALYSALPAQVKGAAA